MTEQSNRSGIGGNNPPPDLRAEIRDEILRLQDQTAHLIAIHPAFETDESLSIAAEVKRELEKAAKAAESTRKAEKAPHDEAGKQVQAYWLPLIARADAAATELASRMRAELSRRKALKDEAERQARAEAERLRMEADKAANEAALALTRVADGEIADSNHLEARAASIDAHAAARNAEALADRISATTAGVRVQGTSAVSIRTVRKVRLALPLGNRERRARDLYEFMDALGRTSCGQEMTDTMLRLANRVYRERRLVLPHCEEYDEESVT